MKQVALRLLLAVVLVMQGSVAALAGGSSAADHEQCAHQHAMTSMAASTGGHASHCPCCPQPSPCPGHDCAAFCAGCAAMSVLAPADHFVAAPYALLAPPPAALALAADRSDGPPTRPPIS